MFSDTAISGCKFKKGDWHIPRICSELPETDKYPEEIKYIESLLWQFASDIESPYMTNFDYNHKFYQFNKHPNSLLLIPELLLINWTNAKYKSLKLHYGLVRSFRTVLYGMLYDIKKQSLLKNTAENLQALIQAEVT